MSDDNTEGKEKTDQQITVVPGFDEFNTYSEGGDNNLPSIGYLHNTGPSTRRSSLTESFLKNHLGLIN